jgi:hypothetical protein
MSKFILGLFAAILLTPAPAFSQFTMGPAPFVKSQTGFVDVGNRSEICGRLYHAAGTMTKVCSPRP